MKHASFLSVSCLFVVFAGCTAGVEDDEGAKGAGGSGSGAFSGDGGSGAGFEAGGGEPCSNRCSADLHAFVDCDGNVLNECPDDQACNPDGSCGEPCAAADANKSTIGCEFYSATTPVLTGSRGGCFAAMIANTWTTPVSLSVDYNGEAIDAAQFTYVVSGQNGSLSYTPLAGGQLQPGQFGVVMLSQVNGGLLDPYQVDCPVPSALNESTQLPGTGRGHAFHIQASAPVVAYDVYPWGGATSYATSATLLLPSSSWGTNFVSADAWESSNGKPFTQIVAAQDNTSVTVVPVTNVAAANGLPAMPANTPTTFTMAKGEVVQLLETARLAGSVFASDKPISVWGGSDCMNIPTGMDACDAAHQQLIPVQSLGNSYIAARYPNRGGDDQAPYTIVGVVDGTQLSFEPAPAGAPSSLNKGQVYTFNTDQAFTVKSQGEDFPFYLAAHMTGGATNSEGLGDPEYVNMVPPAQYLPRYLFVTDPTYKYTSLVFTRQRGKDGTFKDVTLDCMGTIGGWQPVGNGDAEVSRLMIVAGGANMGSCANGVHEASSAAPFGLTVWGYDYYASYAYPAGMSVAQINDVVAVPE